MTCRLSRKPCRLSVARDVTTRASAVVPWRRSRGAAPPRGSEPAVSLSRTLLMETAIRRDATGYVIDGVKHFCTMALGAAHYMIWCALDGGTDMAKSLQLALVPAETPGISTDGKWDTLGMRATFSPSVTFTGVRVPDDGMLGDPGAALRAGVIESFALGYAAIYIGIAESALSFALDYAKQRIVKPENIAVAMDPTVQRHIGELAAHLEAIGRNALGLDAAMFNVSGTPPRADRA